MSARPNAAATRLAVVGLSHHTAPLEVRERFVCDTAAAVERVRATVRAAAGECILLSTCNRTELYLACDAHADDAISPAMQALIDHSGLGTETRDEWLFIRRDREAVRHVFRVAAGLDSLVVGEAQIQGQVRAALEQAQADGPGRRDPRSAALARLFQSALFVGARVRTETRLGVGAASVPSAAVELGRKIFGSLRGRQALVVGAGEMSELALRCFAAEGVTSAVVAGRSAERTADLARRSGADAIALDDMLPLLARADIVVTATASPRPFISAAMVGSAIAGRRRDPLLIVDIALPRDVDPAVGELDNVFLYDLDDLRAVVEGTLDRRRGEIEDAERIVDEAITDYWGWYLGRGAVPLIRELRGRAERLRKRELDRTLRTLRHLPPGDRAAIEHMSRQLLAKLLHAPTARLREAAATGRDGEVTELARYLFALDQPPPADAPAGEHDRKAMHHTAEDME